VSVLVVEGVCLGPSRRTAWVPLLGEVHFEIERGEVVAIVGGRRSGKTMLLQIAAGIRKPECGSVRLGERELTQLRERTRVDLRGRELIWLDRRGMAQRLKVASMVGWSVSLKRGRREAARAACQMLERVGVLDCAGKRWAELSPWEQVCAGLARAFIATPELVIVDDLLDGLGPEGTLQASRLLRSLIADSESRPGVLMSVSDRDSAVLADRVWSLASGKLKPTAGHRRSSGDVIEIRRPKGGESRGVG
jgi:predicted ABC-type transport system involved in lysophospholipase L1 biosynthesis ATPase subunit